MNIYLLNINSSWRDTELAAVCTSLDKAILMMREWYDSEVADKARLEDVTLEVDIDGEFSTATIRNERGAWEEMSIKVGETDDWL